MAKRKKDAKGKSGSVGPTLKTELGTGTCFSCGKGQPGGLGAPLPHPWQNHCIDDESYKRGYWLPITCSNECRKKGGFSV